MRPGQHNASGFSMAELLLAVALGLLILGSTMQLFKSGMDATVLVSQQSDLQQNMRAALNLIAKDVSMAGSGLPQGGLSLPTGNGAIASLFGADPTQSWLANNTYPDNNYMYGILPGPGNGMELGGPANIAATGQTPDAITVIYKDYAFPLNQYTVTWPDASGTSINLAPPANPPAGFPAILSVNGIQVGDLILLQNSLGAAVGEVTGITNNGATLDFANNDTLKINQTGAPTGEIAHLDQGTPPPQTVATRIWAVTYFIEVPNNGQPPRLMRQVNSQPATPVSDNIIGLKFTYDLCDGTNGPNCSGVSDPIASGFTPNQINKVDIQIMGQSLASYVKRSRSTVLSTSVSTRGLTFKDRYQ
jgi:hypothetical protein